MSGSAARLDRELESARAYRPGSAAEFDRLYRESYGRLLATLISVLHDREAAEDCVQEAFVKAFQAWSRWRPDAPAEAWLHRIAINVAISYRRKQKLREVPELLRRLGRPEIGADPAAVATRGDLLAALQALPPKQAATIVMRYHHGYTNREIGTALGVPERTVASRLNAAKLRLQRELGPAWDEATGIQVQERVS